MSTAAARRKALCPALAAIAAALLAAGVAEASLRNDAGRAELLAARSLATALAPGQVPTLAATATSPFHLFPALASAPHRVEAEKLASGPPTWEPQLNVWEIRHFASISRRTLANGAFPGGQTSLAQGAWTDPVDGLSYHRNRWLDTRNAAWLSADPLGDIDSPNLYLFAKAQPHIFTDPMGTETLVVAYGQGYLTPKMRGDEYDVGRQFQLAAETRARELRQLAERENVKRRAAGKSGPELLYVEGPTLVSNKAEFANLLNKPRPDTGPIQQLDVFSHAWQAGLNFGGVTPAENDWTLRNFTIGDLPLLNWGIFKTGAPVTFYGCHTADPSAAAYVEATYHTRQTFAEAFAAATGTRVTGNICGSHFEYREGNVYQVPDHPGQVTTFPTPPPATPTVPPGPR